MKKSLAYLMALIFIASITSCSLISKGNAGQVGGKYKQKKHKKTASSKKIRKN